MTRVYISGGMTGLPNHNFPAFDAEAALWAAAGYEVENPADKGIVDGWSWEEYLRYDLKKLLDCDMVVTLPGWENSRGANLEVYVARSLGMRVVLPHQRGGVRNGA